MAANESEKVMAMRQLNIVSNGWQCGINVKIEIWQY
jgi:hypothetical protein